MFKKSAFILLLAFCAIQAQAQQPSWKALEDYHAVMSQTFHPSEEGNLQPIKERSAELAQKAKALKKSVVPEAFQKPGVKEILAALAKESKALDKMVQKKKSDAEITKALAALHDRFHELVEKCNH